MPIDDSENEKPEIAEKSAIADEPKAEPAEAAEVLPDGVSVPPVPVVADEPLTGWKRFVPFGLALLTPLLFFFVLPPLSKSGLWDPYELNVADLARRLSLNLFGAQELWLTGTDNSMPHLNDLGRPELPFDSIAIGFKLFGLHEWAGRVPLAVWGTAGVLATYGFVARLIDRRAAVYSAVALCTMPLFFVQARTMLGDIVTMSALAMAFGGFAVTIFDRDERGPSRLAVRLPWLAIGILGAVCGYLSRGGILGLGVPMVGIGLAWVVAWASGQRRFELLGDLVGVIVLVVGIRVIMLGIADLGEKPTNLSLWVGAMLKTPSKYPTFDYFVGHLGPALAPWSAFVPFALGRLFLAPPGRQGSLLLRESVTRVAILTGAAVAFAAHGWLAARTELIAFSAPAILAAACGIAIRDYERGAHPSVAVGVGTGVFLGVFHHDFHEVFRHDSSASADRVYQAFAVNGATFPDSFKDQALVLWTVVLVGFAGIAFLTWVERDGASEGASRKPFDPARYLGIVNALREAWDGLLALAYFAMVAGASIAALAIWIGAKTHAKWLPTLSSQIRDGVLNAWWVTAFVPLAAILGVFFACDVWLWAFGRARPLGVSSLTRGFEPFEDLFERLKGPRNQEWTVAVTVLVPFMVLLVPAGIIAFLLKHDTRPLVAAALGIPSGVAAFLALGFIGDLLRGSRAAFFPLFGAVTGAILCFSYYPALANQLSPKEVFESYERVHKSGDPLGLFGVGGRTSAYYAGGQPPTFNDTQAAFTWLTGVEQDHRRFLVMKTDELSKLNQMYRERLPVEKRTNLPVLDGRSSQIVLVASTLESGEKNQNTLNKVVLSAMPKPQHQLDVNMEDKLLVIGYDLTDQTGKLVDSVTPGRKYHFKTYYKVLAPVTTEWEAFIHIDGYHRRHNGDHKPMDGKYPFHLWLKDDLMLDDHEFALEPNFTPGTYTIFFGLFVGDTRLKVTKGASDGDNRVNGGGLRVQ